jgi:hypothetical protein
LAKNLYLLVVATVQKKGEDWKFYKLGIEIWPYTN